jgi:uncharacterized CHY-type Zn-finger protein
MQIIKSLKMFPAQTFNNRTYYQYEGRYFTSHTRKMHRDVWEFYNGEIPKGYHIHHIDGNPSNNEISNLQLIEASEHLRMEGKRRHQENPEWSKEFYTKGIELAKEWHKSVDGRLWHSEKAKKQWENPSVFFLNCIQCDTLYLSFKSTTTKFCSNKCKSNHRRLSGVDNEKRICVVCNTEFEANKYSTKSKCKLTCKKTFGNYDIR